MLIAIKHFRALSWFFIVKFNTFVKQQPTHKLTKALVQI